MHASNPHGRDRRYRLLADAVSDAVAVVVGGSIVEVNPAFSAVFGYSLAEVQGLELDSLLGSDGGEIRSGMTRSGSLRQLEVTERAIPPAGAARIIVMRDVTERNVAQREADVLAYQYAADLTAVAEVARRLPRTSDPGAARNAICQALLEVCDGMLAVLMEPDGRSGLVSTGIAGRGQHSAPLRVAVDEAGSATADVFSSRRAVLHRRSGAVRRRIAAPGRGHRDRVGAVAAGASRRRAWWACSWSAGIGR